MRPEVTTHRQNSALVSLDAPANAGRRYQFTSKLESMFTDIKTSRDSMQQFKQHQANAASASGAADDIDLAVQVRRPCGIPCTRMTLFHSPSAVKISMNF